MTEAISGTSGTAASQGTSLYSGTSAAAAPKQEMDQEVFLSLLVAQLRNQDPSAPMDTSEMMAQSTQLASMEKMSEMADTTRESFELQARIAAANLVGSQVSALGADGVQHTGVATGVDFTTGTPMITVDGTQVTLGSITAVTAVTSTPQSTATTDTPAA